MCKLGLDGDGDNGFMKMHESCNAAACSEASTEDKLITRDLGFPNMDDLNRGQINTLDDCFSDMVKVTYGSRVQAKLVDDQSCEDVRYQSICQEQMIQNRVLLEEKCRSPGYKFLTIIS